MHGMPSPKTFKLKNRKSVIATVILTPPSKNSLNPIFNPLDTEIGFTVCSNYYFFFFHSNVCSSLL